MSTEKSSPIERLAAALSKVAGVELRGRTLHSHGTPFAKEVEGLVYFALGSVESPPRERGRGHRAVGVNSGETGKGWMTPGVVPMTQLRAWAQTARLHQADESTDRHLWAARVLPLDRDSRVLEIGCGAGQMAAWVCGCLSRGHLTALDPSATAVARAKVRMAPFLKAGRATLLQGAFPSALAPHLRFDLITAFNVNLFWTQGPEAFLAARAHLAARGRVLLFFSPPKASALAALENAIRRNAAQASLRVDLATTESVGPVRVLLVGLKSNSA